jgi:hypothetical protein
LFNKTGFERIWKAETDSFSGRGSTTNLSQLINQNKYLFNVDNCSAGLQKMIEKDSHFEITGNSIYFY